MKKILLIVFVKNPTTSELQHPERLISVQTAKIENLPSSGDTFTPITESSLLTVYNCLKVDENDHRKPCDVIDGYNAIVYATISHHLND